MLCELSRREMFARYEGLENISEVMSGYSQVDYS